MAVILAIALCTAVNLITIGVLLAAYYRGQKSGDYSLSENATQILLTILGGMIGLLGGYIGGSTVAKSVEQQRAGQAERDQMLLNAGPLPSADDQQDDDDHKDDSE